MISAISYFYVNNTYDDFEIEMDKFVQEYYLNKKNLKKEMIRILDILNYNVKKQNANDGRVKSRCNKVLNNITFKEENKSNCFFLPTNT